MAQQRLREAAEQAKIELSSKLETEIKTDIEKASEAALALPSASYENHLKTAIDKEDI